jgi:hypothetical protein
VSSCVPWNFADNDGLNPTGVPGDFDFNVWYELEYLPPGQAIYDTPDFEIVGVTCPYVQFDNESRRRRPFAVEHAQLCDWFSSYIDSHPDEYEAIKDQAFEYSFVEPDYDDQTD